MKNLIIGILFVSFPAVGQEFNFNIQDAKVHKFIELEEQLGSEKNYPKTTYISSNGIAQPIQYVRKEKILPDLCVFYYFKEKDSTISHILYEWDVSNFEKKQNNQKSKKFEKALIKRYKNIKTEISKNFDSPEVKSNYSNISRLSTENLFEENARWSLENNIEIELYAIASNYYLKKGLVTINPTHKIRLYVRNDK